MKENINCYFMHTHVLLILSLVFLLFNTTTATSFGHRLAAATGGAANMCIDKERQVLLDFNVHLRDDPDGKLFYLWRPEEEDDCCQWEYVTCNNQTGHITMIDLRNSEPYVDGFEGEIGLSLLNLTYLNYFDLSYNSFIGTIPPLIGNIPLTYLDLGHNHLTGTIPESIGNMTRLTHLDLCQNHLIGTIPESIGNMARLTHLDLGQNHLNGTIPKSIINMTHLTTLYVGENNFCGTIPTFGNLTNLVELSLSILTIENLDWLSSLSKLKILYLDGSSLAKANHWVNVIIGLQNLEELSLNSCDLSQVMHPYSSSVNSSSSIHKLYLDNNNLNSSMCSWLCPLIGNKIPYFGLSLSGNKFDGKLSDFLNILSGCTLAINYLEALDASRNQFTGSLSDEIQHFLSLYYLNLSYNQLDGNISDKLWQLSNLQYLDLSSNSRIRGNVPKLTNESMIDRLILSNNLIEGLSFTDSVPAWLSYIDFRSNKIGPHFPKGIQALSRILHLDFSNNDISDTFPTNGRNQCSLPLSGYFNLSFNNMSGRLPDFQSNGELTIVDLTSNNFHGRVPVFPAELSYLDLSRNKFHGGISFLCHFYERSLEFLDLSHNSLTGQLPDCLRKLTSLRVLNLGHNFFSGRLPPSIGYVSQLEMLCLYNNSFSGKLHSYLKNCTKLSLLDLGANKFSGNVPVWIGENFPRLYVLSLRSNNFFGNIPLQICHLITLQILDLSKNNLQGTIPPCVNNLTTMVQKGFFVKQNVHHFHLSLSVEDYGQIREKVDNSYIDHLMIEWQGKLNEFSSTVGLVKTIDLSSNNLIGQIAFEITNLHGLLALDLSNNALVGEIPRDIGQMQELLTLNLSRNMFSGEMPSTMSKMDRLNDLDVSYNNLSGRVPSSTQLQSFPPERFTGNAGLCGLPTIKICLGDEELGVPPVSESEGDGESTNELWKWFYIGGATGFATAFWIACSALLLNRRVRHAFFRFHNCLKDWVYVKVLVFIARLQRVAGA